MVSMVTVLWGWIKEWLEVKKMGELEHHRKKKTKLVWVRDKRRQRYVHFFFIPKYFSFFFFILQHYSLLNCLVVKAVTADSWKKMPLNFQTTMFRLFFWIDIFFFICLIFNFVSNFLFHIYFIFLVDKRKFWSNERSIILLSLHAGPRSGISQPECGSRKS